MKTVMRMIVIFISVNCVNAINIFLSIYQEEKYPNDTENIDTLLSSCLRGSKVDCYMLGTAYVYGEGVKVDKKESFKFFAISCDIGNVMGCLRLADSYATGVEVDKDLNKAKSFLQKACELGYSPSCIKYENMGL